MPVVTSVLTPPDPTPPVALPEIGYASIVYYAPDGTAWPMTDQGRDFFALAEGVAGLGAAPYEVTYDAHPRGGSRLRHVQPQSRTIMWPLHVQGATHQEFITLWRSLARAFTDTLRRDRDGNLRPGVLEVARPDGTRRRIECYYQEGFDGLGRFGSGVNWDQAILTLYCEDPYWVDPVPRVVHRESGSGEDFFQPYPSVSSSQVLGATEIDNDGDVIVWPEWTVTGPASLVTFTNDDTGESFTLDPSLVSGSLLAHEEVVISTDPPRVRKMTAEVQTISLGAASAGTITITFDGQTTAAIAFDADAAAVQAALEALSNLDVGDVFVTGGPLPAEITLTFAGQYLGTDVPEVVVTPTGLTGGTVTVTTVTEGGTANWFGALNWPQAVLWGLPPGENAVTFQLDGSGTGSAVDVSINPRYETA